MKFTKMHGSGNDFVVINSFEQELPAEEKLPELSRFLCDRHFGIGSDGMILVLPSRVADFRMRMLNPDGSESEMCGNGIRCFAKFVHDRGLTKENTVQVETLAGIKVLKLNVRGGKVESVRVDMGNPVLLRKDIPMRGDTNTEVIGETLRVDGKKFEVTCVSVGNPHCAIFVDDVENFPVTRIGPQIENHKAFPKRTNVEFIQVKSNTEIFMRVWERGAGETLACGTGACASTVASALNKKTGRQVTVHLKGGDLHVEWTGDNRIMMTGPAEEVFTGEVCYAIR
ncbi:MAG: diaminopimelate epimerase [Armatimonadetes bacterium]|nr:diaminopimelate epimerase [Armatimonadota bacterium]